MKKVVVSGKTVEDAISLALEQLQTSKDKVKVTVLEQPTKGLFGLIGSKEARVEVEKQTDPIDDAKRFLESVFDTMEIEVAIALSHEEDQVVFNLVGSNLGVIIGKRGQTLDSLQYLANTVANRSSRDHPRIVLDAENYRERREDALKKLAERLADRAIQTKKDVILEPMTPLERKIIHSYLQDNEWVSTYSKGEEPNRKIVISPKK